MEATILASLTAITTRMGVMLTNTLALVTGEQLASPRGGVDPVCAIFTLTLLVVVVMFVLAH